MSILLPKSSHNLGTMEVEVYTLEEDIKYGVVRLDGHIADGPTGVKVCDILLGLLREGTTRLLVDCKRVTYLGQTVGSMALVGPAKMYQAAGAKIILVNCADVLLRHDDFGTLFEFASSDISFSAGACFIDTDILMRGNGASGRDGCSSET